MQDMGAASHRSLQYCCPSHQTSLTPTQQHTGSINPVLLCILYNVLPQKFLSSLKHSIQDNELSIGSSLKKRSFFQGHEGASIEFLLLKTWYQIAQIQPPLMILCPNCREYWSHGPSYNGEKSTMVQNIWLYYWNIFLSNLTMWRASTYNPISAVLEIKFLVSSFFLTFCNAIMKFAWAAPGKMPALCGNQIKGRKWGLFRQFSAIQS